MPRYAPQAGASAQAPLGLNADRKTAFIARTFAQAGFGIVTPFGGWFSHPIECSVRALLSYRSRACAHPSEALPFQTGYLTIQGIQGRGGTRFYQLGYPNREVRQSLNESVLRWLVQDHSSQSANGARLPLLLEANDFAGFEALFEAFYASIPYQWYTNNDIADYEGFYASVFYSYFASLGLDITVEDSSLRGRADMSVRFNDNLYLFEFKVVETASEGAALAQLRKKGYADKYRHLGQPIHQIGVKFSKESRTLASIALSPFSGLSASATSSTVTALAGQLLT